MSTRRLCPKLLGVSCSKRFNSTLYLPDEYLSEKRTVLQEHLIGRPFDSENRVSIPENSIINEVAVMNDKAALPSPFVSFDSNDAFKLILLNSLENAMLSKYQKFFRLKYDSDNMYQSQIEMIYFWRHRLFKDLKEISLFHLEANMKLSDKTKQIFLDAVNQDDTFDFTQSVEKLSRVFPHISLEVLVSWYVKISPFLTEVKREVFLRSMNLFFEKKVLHFHYETLENILLDLLAFNHTKSATSIITLHDSTSNSEFLSHSTLSFAQTYLVSLLKQKDVKVAHHVFEHIVERGYKPLPEIVEKYAELINETATGVDATKQKKEMLFNLLSKPLVNVLMQPKMLNANILRSLLDFIRLHNITAFIKYLQYSPEYKNIKELPELILNRIQNSTTFLKKSDQRKAKFLTGTLNQLGFSVDDLEESVKYRIISMYADSHSPLAVLRWSKFLKSPLTVTQKREILEKLKGISDNASNIIDISDKL
ncbi:hypothetical protein CANINC_001382 [Pichia inconspicua]|uniref:ATPase expression protein 1 n=1 Tax=Pichia inconspicua TaxID=52247 RepID=A0A4T0X456_9ASCO|nr:hypothetical protein CANINC_001382 [[Candida] inconspicua]